MVVVNKVAASREVAAREIKAADKAAKKAASKVKATAKLTQLIPSV